MKLIDVYALMSKAFTDERGYNVVYVDDMFKEPVIDAEPVKHGHWIIIDDVEFFTAKCSVCGRIEDTRLIKNYPYCHCGAKMDGGK